MTARLGFHHLALIVPIMCGQLIRWNPLVFLEQRIDLSTAIDQLLDDIAAGRKYMKVYRQMKMYNDPSTNPVLYGNKK